MPQLSSPSPHNQIKLSEVSAKKIWIKIFVFFLFKPPESGPYKKKWKIVSEWCRVCVCKNFQYGIVVQRRVQCMQKKVHYMCYVVEVLARSWRRLTSFHIHKQAKDPIGGAEPSSQSASQPATRAIYTAVVNMHFKFQLDRFGLVSLWRLNFFLLFIQFFLL